MKSSTLLKVCELTLLCLGQLYIATAQTTNGSITGFVKTSDGQPAELVNISLQGTQYGSITDLNGTFSLLVPTGNYVAIASIIGFASQQQNVVVAPNETTRLDFTLNETSQQLEEVIVTGIKAIPGMGFGHLSEINNHIIYSAKKTEVLLLDSLDANTAQNNPRQVLGRVPGANYSETENGGFPSNGIAFRGLNPTQSIETNTRQNGYNITADLYGYPESYYLPALEGVERIEVTRSASSLQFGPQFGGVINYIMKKGSTSKPIEFTTQQTGGSFGLYNSFTSVGGQIGKFNYYAFVQYQNILGWRPNSQVQKISGYERIEYQPNQKIKIGLEFSLLRNRIQMPGGFNDSLFYLDNRRSYRARNWLRSPWSLITATFEWKIAQHTILSITNATNISARDLVWRNEYGGPAAVDDIDPITHQYGYRESQHEDFNSNTTEARFLTRYRIKNKKNALAYGIRFFKGKMKRQGGGLGTTGTDFDFTVIGGKYEYDLDFTTTNVAVFAENTFYLGERLSITPGLRYEYLNSTIKGFNPSEDELNVIYSDLSKSRYIFLAGIGLQFKTTSRTNIYLNCSKNYRPINYSDLTPYGSIGTTNDKLKDASGYTTDLGFRGSVKNYLNFDIGAFYLQYNNRIGFIQVSDGEGNIIPYRTNMDNSVHKGLESYVEFNPVKAFSSITKWSFSFFNSLAIIDARYVTGKYTGNYVEYAPTHINRFGSTIAIADFSTTLLISSTAKSFGEPNNATEPSDDPASGIIPAYTVLDWSATLKIRNFNLKTGFNNLTDTRYFTKRTNEYPGPGIIPAIGRSFYFGIGVKI